MMVGMFVVAGNRVVFWIFKVAVGPAVRSVRAQVGSARRSAGRDSGGVGGCEHGRRSDRARGCGRGGRASRSACGVGAVEANGTGRGGEAAILVGRAKMEGKIGEGF